MVQFNSDLHASVRLQKSARHLLSCGHLHRAKPSPAEQDVLKKLRILIKENGGSTCQSCGSNLCSCRSASICGHKNSIETQERFSSRADQYLQKKWFPSHGRKIPPKETKKAEEDLAEESMSSLLQKFSVLVSEIKAIWQGENSLKVQIESLERRQQAVKVAIRSLEASQMALKEKIQDLEQDAKKRDESLERMREERTQSVQEASKGKAQTDEVSAMQRLDRHQDDQIEKVNSTELRQMETITRSWKENNCDVHLKRIIYSSRQIVAFEMLDFAHKRLTNHMSNHLSETVKSLSTEEKTSYLSTFRQGGPYKNKAISEGTYAELLEFVEQSRKPRKELLRALRAAEERLIQEAEREGYASAEVGDIREQMMGFLLAERQFRSGYCHPILLADWEITKEVIEDTKKAAKEGKLGVLQKASKLICLGCYLLCKQQ